MFFICFQVDHAVSDKKVNVILFHMKTAPMIWNFTPSGGKKATEG